MPELLTTGTLALAAVVYLRGADRLRRRGVLRPDRSRLPAAGAGFAVLVVALASPLDRAAAGGLSAHMVQHLLLVAVAPPLLVAGGCLAPLLAGLPGGWRPALTPAQRLVRALGTGRPAAIAAAAGAQTAVLWAWHAPVLYDAAARHAGVHVAEHASFLAAGLAFWWAVAGLRRRSAYGTGVLALFAAGLPVTALGAAMSTAGAPWYGAYAGAGALADQQLAGVVMWAFGGLAAVTGAAVLFAAWLLSWERAAPGWPAGWSGPGGPAPGP